MKKDNLIIHVPEKSTPDKFFTLLVESKIKPDEIYFKDYVFKVKEFYMYGGYWHVIFDVNTDAGLIKVDYCINNEYLTWTLFENALFVTAEGVKVHART